VTYKPDPLWLVAYNGGPAGWREGACELSKEPRPSCVVGNGKGFVYVTPNGRWTHTRCYHQTHGARL
jgi:hypothetical protein